MYLQLNSWELFRTNFKKYHWPYLQKPALMTFMLRINENIVINDHYLQVSYVRSRGPGGQNVNKVNTCCQLSFDLRNCPVLTAAVKNRCISLAGRRMTNQGVMIIQSDRFRRQIRNRTDCFERLSRLICKALIPPTPRRPTKPSAASKRKRLEGKQHRSKTKNLRRKVSQDE